MELKICHMYPDILNLYGDRGNVTCMVKRLQWRSIPVDVQSMPLGTGKSLNGFDLVFIGGGQDFEQQLLLDELKRGKAKEIKAAVEDGVTFLTICGGFQLLGNYYKNSQGRCMDFVGAIDMYTQGDKERLIGNYKFQCCPEAGGSVVAGFENHSGKTYLGNGVSPLGKVLKGFGNNGSDGTEGAHYKNVFGTYSHGPVLPKNPEFCDFILETALRRKYGTAQLAPLDDRAELSAHDEMCRKLD